MSRFPMSEPEPKPLLAVSCLRKAFPGVQALDGVDFDLFPGEVHALVGENGAGKSTLIKILSGAYAPDEGVIHVGGQQFQALSPRQAQALGIRTIYQELSLVPWLSVAENILVGDLPGRGFMVNWKEVNQKAGRILEDLGLDLDPEATVAELSVARQQSVEIAKALYQHACLVIMDEPTSTLGRTEVERLFKTVEALRQQGIGIIYISHHLEEVFQIADRVTVLRDGRVVGSKGIRDTDPQNLMNMMVGRDLSGINIKEMTVLGEEILRVEGLSRGKVVNEVSLQVRRGEILGIAGMVGSGRTELARLIAGVDRPDRGRIFFNGKELPPGNPGDYIRRGIALVPEDRKTQGLVLCLDIVDNMNLASLTQRSRVVNVREMAAAARRQAQALDLRSASLNQEVQYLSGGNQQKVVLAKWLETGADLFIFDEPTRGVDVGAKLEIHRLIASLAGQGKAILVVSSDMPEVLTMSDRILVMRRGSLAGEFSAAEATEHKIIQCALGEFNGKNGS
jgi:ribose transport system ATP-binding protein